MAIAHRFTKEELDKIRASRQFIMHSSPQVGRDWFKKHWMWADDAKDNSTVKRRDKIIDAIVEKAGWEKNWNCTKNLADAIEKIIEEKS